MTQVPITTELDRSIAFVEALGQGHLFGRGTAEDPLFPVDVALLGEDGNVYAITSRVEKAIKSYLRGSGIGRDHALAIAKAARAELWTSQSYDDVLERVVRLVRAQ